MQYMLTDAGKTKVSELKLNEKYVLANIDDTVSCCGVSEQKWHGRELVLEYETDFVTLDE